MEKKRPSPSEPEESEPPSKQPRSATDDEPHETKDQKASNSARSNDSITNCKEEEKKEEEIKAETKPVPTEPVKKESVMEMETEQEDVTPLVTFQRAQLAAKISEQQRELLMLRDKVEGLQKLVAVLDAAPRAALYHMYAVREDLTLTLARLGLSNELEPKECPIAATMLDAEVVTNESLAEMPTALKKLSAQIILALEGSDVAKERKISDEMKQTNDELHGRLRIVSDQLERYAEREKQSLVSFETFRDEHEDLREESSMQRRRIVALELKLKEKDDELAAKNAKIEVQNEKQDSIMRESQDGGAGHSQSNGNLEAEALAKEIHGKRLQELKEAHEENKRITSEVETLRAEIARRDNNVVPVKAILGTALYQTMEATLQQLYLKERSWQTEKETLAEERDAERKDAEERLEEARAAADEVIGDLKKQVEDLRKIGDAAKIEKDKVVMTYEARKMEAGNAAVVIAAAEKRANVSEEMRDKLSKANADLKGEVENLRSRLKSREEDLAGKQSSDTKKIMDDIRRDLDDERAKSNSFIQEVESLSNMFGEVESENEKLVKLLTEKEQVLSKVMAERLRGRQLLTTIKEENRALTQGREIDSDKIKQLTSAVAASKKVAQEATVASNKTLEESRVLATTLEKRRRIADEATVSARAMTSEKEQMKRERDACMTRAEKVMLEYKEDQYEAKRLREKLLETEQKLKEAEDMQLNSMESCKETDSDPIRDAIIRDLRKKLNCSIITSMPKEVVLLRCGHLFSRQCTDNLISTRNRKCPICGKAFGNDDVRNIFF